MSLADLLIALDRARAENAEGWVVLVVDTESDEPLSVWGMLDTEEAALAVAGEFDRDPDCGLHPRDGSPGCRHLILPLFKVPAGG